MEQKSIKQEKRKVAEFVRQTLEKLGYKEDLFYIDEYSIEKVDNEYFVELDVSLLIDDYRDKEKIKKLLKEVNKYLGRAELIISFEGATVEHNYWIENGELKEHFDYDADSVYVYLKIYIPIDKVKTDYLK